MTINHWILRHLVFRQTHRVYIVIHHNKGILDSRAASCPLRGVQPPDFSPWFDGLMRKFMWISWWSAAEFMVISPKNLLNSWLHGGYNKHNWGLTLSPWSKDGICFVDVCGHPSHHGSHESLLMTMAQVINGYIMLIDWYIMGTDSNPYIYIYISNLILMNLLIQLPHGC